MQPRDVLTVKIVKQIKVSTLTPYTWLWVRIAWYTFVVILRLACIFVVLIVVVVATVSYRLLMYWKGTTCPWWVVGADPCPNWWEKREPHALGELWGPTRVLTDGRKGNHMPLVSGGGRPVSKLTGDLYRSHESREFVWVYWCDDMLWCYCCDVICMCDCDGTGYGICPRGGMR